MTIPILYEDAEALVIDKPAGLPIEKPRAGGPSLSDHWEELKLGFHRLPAPSHRIDTDTSGCLLLARNPRALRRFASAFAERQVSKRYLGILSEIPGTREGTIELGLTKISSEKGGWRMIAARRGKPSVTHWRLIAEIGHHALVEFRPETGRTHQIRVHAASGIGIPLLGDPIYGKAGSAPRTMLHSAGIEMPRYGKDPIIARAPLPADFVDQGFTDE
ncbi:tRNA pseudouridine32 synthase/23S rRNA pseudouridine746 synthase [Altererythrobacter atlanticus]|uniref:Ribosomal large subunit pseudouridine synthase D n=1 Tax=Croceibacterium atlanticum TaxID=1267766 RepID=A0A0F7KV55_9SPHN|nr:RNA pseudouridine synthase [Croceibacterium atlanticum]AKH43117.1 Ribosomal large subunit pseudouridine synthase D [Croceibacterium atlanticum]MBB5732179.1 tRNA pseudouridine32 synthase/23S rRNA pseudouridine746 synthase [Croceibacterium atlanticum]